MQAAETGQELAPLCVVAAEHAEHHISDMRMWRDTGSF